MEHTCSECLGRGKIILMAAKKITNHIHTSLRKTLLRRIWRGKQKERIYRQNNDLKFKQKIIQRRRDKFTNTAFWK